MLWMARVKGQNTSNVIPPYSTIYPTPARRKCANENILKLGPFQGNTKMSGNTFLSCTKGSKDLSSQLLWYTSILWHCQEQIVPPCNPTRVPVILTPDPVIKTVTCTASPSQEGGESKTCKHDKLPRFSVTTHTSLGGPPNFIKRG